MRQLPSLPLRYNRYLRRKRYSISLLKSRNRLTRTHTATRRQIVRVVVGRQKVATVEAYLLICVVEHVIVEAIAISHHHRVHLNSRAYKRKSAREMRTSISSRFFRPSASMHSTWPLPFLSQRIGTPWRTSSSAKPALPISCTPTLLNCLAA